MPTFTTNYSFNKPLVNNATDADLWGGQLNTNFDSLDTLLFGGLSKFTTEGTIASATTTNLGSITATNIISITGTTTITGFGSSASTANPLYFVRFTGILTLTHNGTSLILPSAANITTAAGDAAILKYEGSGNWRCMNYARASGQPVAIPTNTAPTIQTFTSSGTYTAPAGLRAARVRLVGGGGGGGGVGATNPSCGGSGGGGGYSEEWLTAATIGVSQVVTIGAAGAGGASGLNNGTAGGTTSFGSLLQATGGAGGVSQTGNVSVIGGLGGVGSGGNINLAGQPATHGTGNSGTAAFNWSGIGGASMLGAGAIGNASQNTAGQNAPTGFGGGGSGATGSGSSSAGGNGTAGIIIVEEFY